jgi:hypothetical protein
LVE